MALIKNSQAAMMAREAVVLDLGDLRRQGDALVGQARSRAEVIVREAEAERDRIVAGAAERGHAEGLERGLAAGRRKGEEAGRVEALAAQSEAIAKLTARWTEAVASFEADRAALVESGQRDVIRLAMLIGERVTKRIVRTDPAVASAQVAEALRLVLRPTGVAVAVNPEDRAMVESALPGLAATISGAMHVRLVDDGALSRGSCVVRCVGSGEGGGAGGEIDATIETQLARIAELIVPGGSDDERERGEGGA